MITWTVTLVDVISNDTLAGNYSAETRVEAVRAAFLALTGVGMHNTQQRHKVLAVKAVPS